MFFYRQKRGASLIILSIIVGMVQGQTMLTLDICQQKAHDNYPLINQRAIIEESVSNTILGLNKQYIPQVTLNGQATYQSDVPKIEVEPFYGIDIPKLLGLELPNIPKDQYKVTLDVTQVIWDGNAIPSHKKMIRSQGEVEKQQAEVNLYAIRQKVNDLYFGILSINEQLQLLDVVEEDLQSGLKMAQSLYSNGVVLQSDVDQVQIELLNLEQKRIEALSAKKALMQVLGYLIGEPLDTDTPIAKPHDHYTPATAITRPEMTLFNLQRDYYNAQNATVNAKSLPTLGLFVQGGYGNPGLDMFKDQFQFYAIGGVKFTWNFGNLYSRGNEKNQITTNLNAVKLQEEIFLFNTNMQLLQNSEEIEKYRALIDKDNEIIALRNSVKTAGESKYRNGIYTVNDLIRDINAENQSRLIKALHEMQYLQSIYNYKYTQGAE